MWYEDLTTLDLVDKFISTLSDWDRHENYYLHSLLPRIVRGDSIPGSAVEHIAMELRSRLTPDELASLPETVAKRRLGHNVKFTYDTREQERLARELREAEERQKSEQQRLARELCEAEERQKREEQRLARELREAEERQSRERKLAEKTHALKARCYEWFRAAFLTADSHFKVDPDRSILTDAQYSDLKAGFVQEWADAELHLSLDMEQARAVAGSPGDTLVVARAGAGKTRTLVARAVFLQKHCGVSPGALLLLAFNRAASVEMHQRLHVALNKNTPHVMTFHALAHALVHPDEGLVYDDRSVGNLGLSRAIQGVIDQHLQSRHFRDVIRDLMLMHFRGDWERVVEGGFHLPMQELVEYRSALPRETLKGEYVKSFGEKLIANTLFQHDIDYKYERNYRWGGINYRPDFTILRPDRHEVVIEYFGLQGDPDYDAMSQQKREFWASRSGSTLLEFSPQDIKSVDGFVALLLDRLRQCGVTGRLLSDEEIWKRIRRRAVDKFTSAVKSFVSRCRKKNLSSQDLRNTIARNDPITDAERLFSKVAASVYADYLEQLRCAHQEDFDGLVWRAIALLDSGQSHFARDRGRERGDLARIRHVLVDEFQDFSEMFYRMAQGIRALSPQARFFCVGDDWQAINGFAGSDLRFFEDFGRWFRDSTIFSVSTNYRSPKSVVLIGNALMAERGTPAKPRRTDIGWVRAANLSSFEPSAGEQERHDGDEATPAVLRLVWRLLNDDFDVVMLARRNDIPWYVAYSSDLRPHLDGLERFAEHVRMFLPEEDRKRVTVSTAHGYKGLEKEAVIVLDADKGSYPLIHPNWVFLRVLGDTIQRIEAEERRLFYVALTRSKDALVIFSDGESRESPYLRDIMARTRVLPVEWPELQPVPSLNGARREVRVSNAHSVRDELKRLGYRWNATGRYWYRCVPAESVAIDQLCPATWTTAGVHVAVYTEEGELLQQIARNTRG